MGLEVTGREPQQSGPTKRIRGKNVITAAGLHSDTVARKGGGDSDPAVLAFRGTYYQMKPEFRDICTRNIYPVPSGGGIPVGVHFTPTVNERRGEQMIVGPGACLAFNKEAYTFFDFGLSYVRTLMFHTGLMQFAKDNFNLAFTEM